MGGRLTFSSGRFPVSAHRQATHVGSGLQHHSGEFDISPEASPA